MTTWIVWIKPSRPEHWGIAKRSRFWDMHKDKPVREGDHVFFWQSGGSLLGHVVATSDAAPLPKGAKQPWLDLSTASYPYRFSFHLISDRPAGPLKWGEVAAATGLTRRPQSGIVQTSDPAVSRWLSEQLLPIPKAEVDFHVPEPLLVEIQKHLGEDSREWARRLIALRQGQGKFRERLLSAYDGRCAVTGCGVVDVLEAAHIAPYKGHHTNPVTNGLLLRADIHTLFDRFLITVAADYTVRVAPRLAATPYAEYEGRPIHVLPDVSNRPSLKALGIHHEECDWLAEDDLVSF